MSVLLADMIKGKAISEQQYPFNRFRGSISDLRLEHGLDIRHADEEFTNQFGRKRKYRRHFILSIDREKAIEVYNKINQ